MVIRSVSPRVGDGKIGTNDPARVETGGQLIQTKCSKLIRLQLAGGERATASEKAAREPDSGERSTARFGTRLGFVLQ